MSKRKPKPGDMVRVVWIDSGMDLSGVTERESRVAQLPVREVFGRLTYQDEERVCLAMDVDQGGEGRHGIVWTPSVRSIELLT